VAAHQVQALIVSELCDKPSHHASVQSLHEYLLKSGVPPTIVLHYTLPTLLHAKWFVLVSPPRGCIAKPLHLCHSICTHCPIKRDNMIALASTPP
jgi:hypothetical protein